MTSLRPARQGRRQLAAADAAARSPRRLLATSALVCAACAACAALLCGASAFAGPRPLQGSRGLRRPLRSIESSSVAEAPVDDAEGPQKMSAKWRLGVGKAIDVLRRDTVALFDGESDSIDLSIFSEDIKIVDARVPSFEASGLATYERLLSMMHWSLKAAASGSRMEIVSVAPPVNSEVYMRWRLHIWPRDPLEDARSFFGNLGAFSLGSAKSFRNRGMGMPFIFEGYSRYEFDPWTAEIVKHSIDITNPPTFLSDLIQQYVPTTAWMTPATHGLGVPMRYGTGPSAPSMGGLLLAAGAAGGTLAGGAVPGQATLGPAGSAASQGQSRTSRRAGWKLSMPRSCEDDFECNDGKANYPLQCCEMPLIGSFCCEPDDFERSPDMTPAYVPLPVPIDDWPQRGSGSGYQRQ